MWSRSGLLTPRQLEVLSAVGERRVLRSTLAGDLEPHLLNGRDVSWTLLGLTLRGLVVTRSFGAAQITARGQRALTTAARLVALSTTQHRTDQLSRVTVEADQ